MEPILADSSLPSSIGRYVILGKIGASGTGTVFRAHDPSLDRVVALKQPRFDGSPALQAKRIVRFLQEARVAARVWHPHVCPVYDVGEHFGQPFVVMALVEGGSLAERLAKLGRYERIHEAVRLTVQLLEALAAFHTHDLTHRNVKPGNVLLDLGGRAVLTDFGLTIPEADGDSLDQEEIHLAKPHYLAPEQAAGLSRDVGPTSDLYSVGVVLFQMLTGRLPFEGPPLAVLHRIICKDPPPLRAFRADIDPRLEAVVLKALRKRPEERYPDAESFMAALAPWMSQSVLPQSSVSQDPSVSTPDPEEVPETDEPSSRRWPVLRVGGWVAGGALIAASAFLASTLVIQLLLEDSLPQGKVARDEFASVGVILLLMTSCVGLGLIFWQGTESLHTSEGLFYWAKVGSLECVAYLLKQGLPLDQRDPLGETALMKAVKKGHDGVAKMLLQAGADPDLRNSLGQSCLDLAMAEGHTKVVALLRSHVNLAPKPPADQAPSWRPNASLAFLLFSLAGALLSSVLWMRTFSHPITVDQLFQMAEAKQIHKVQARGTLLVGEMKNPGSLGLDPLRWRGGKFYVDSLGGADAIVGSLWKLDKTIEVGTLKGVRLWPGDLAMIPPVAFPVAFLAALILPWLRWRVLFPMLQEN